MLLITFLKYTEAYLGACHAALIELFRKVKERLKAVNYFCNKVIS